MRKDKFDISQDDLLLMLRLFEKGRIPKSYLIPYKKRATQNDLFRDREYERLKSRSEYSLNTSKKNTALFKTIFFLSKIYKAIEIRELLFLLL